MPYFALPDYREWDKATAGIPLSEIKKGQRIWIYEPSGSTTAQLEAVGAVPPYENYWLTAAADGEGNALVIMLIPTKQEMSMSMIQLALERSANSTISLGDNQVRSLGHDTEGEISMSSFYGHASERSYSVWSQEHGLEEEFKSHGTGAYEDMHGFAIIDDVIQQGAVVTGYGDLSLRPVQGSTQDIYPEWIEGGTRIKMLLSNNDNNTFRFEIWDDGENWRPSGFDYIVVEKEGGGNITYDLNNPASVKTFGPPQYLGQRGFDGPNDSVYRPYRRYIWNGSPNWKGYPYNSYLFAADVSYRYRVRFGLFGS